MLAKLDIPPLEPVPVLIVERAALALASRMRALFRRSYASRRSGVLRSSQARLTRTAKDARAPFLSRSGCTQRNNSAMLRRRSVVDAWLSAPSTR